MLRRLRLPVILATAALLAGLLASPLKAAIWPEQWWSFKRTSLEKLTPGDQGVWQEYGLKEAERATYEDGALKFTATGWRVNDTTAALAVFQWQRPQGWKKSSLSELALENGPNAYFTFGNYVIRLEGYIPDEEKRQILFVQLPRLERGPLPTLPGHLPAAGLDANSERYILGPASLEHFEPRLPPSAAAFHMGAEAQIAQYESTKGPVTLALFSYPTPAMAKKQVLEFGKLSGVLVKRTGPMIAVVVGGQDADFSERLLAQVNYRAQVSWDEQTKPVEPNMGDVILTAFKFAGLLMVVTLLVGAMMAGVRFFGRRYLGWEKEGEALLTLHLDDRR